MVVFAIWWRSAAPDLISARLRIQSYAVWEVVVFVLNVLAFILIGLQLKPILARLSGAELAPVRHGGRRGLRRRHRGPDRVGDELLRRGGPLAAASEGRHARRRGGRRVVRHARHRDAGGGAGAARRRERAFPYRDFILFTAFCVVLGTLVVQGMTVGPLMSSLALRDDGAVDREVRLARAETARAGARGRGWSAIDRRRRARCSTSSGGSTQARLLRAEQGDEALDPAEADGWRDFGSVQRQAYAEERRTLSDLRARGVIGDDAFHRVEEELDWAEVNAESRRL